MALCDRWCFQYRRHAASYSAAEAMAGKRFAEARRYFVDAAAQMEALGWPRAAKAARRYTASRLHAVTLLPSALKARSGAGVRTWPGTPSCRPPDRGAADAARTPAAGTRVAVLGATGFVGRAVTRTLIAQGAACWA